MTLHVHTYGPPDSPPLLALHGVSGHGQRFADLAGRLGRFRVIAPDLRGHGHSTALPPWDLRNQVDDLAELVDGLGEFSLLGHSSGGVLGLRLAHHMPDRIDRLILLDPGTLSSKQPELALANAERMRIDVSYAEPTEARADRIRNGWASVPAELLDAEMAQHLEQTSAGRWIWRYNRSALVALLGELTRPVPAPPASVPTLLVIATASSAVTGEYRASCGGNVTVAEIDCGHLVYYERPESTAECVGAFLTQK